MATLSEFLEEWHSDDEYVVAHTSGSTGTPKEIRLPKSDMKVSALATNAFFGIDKDSVLALPLSLDYIAGKMMAVRADLAGCNLIELPVSNRVNVSFRIDLLPVVPSQLPELIKNPKAPSLIRNLLVGGAPLSDSMANELVRCGFNAWLGYGMTETCSHVALRKIGDSSVFHAMPGVRFDNDSRGCLIIKSEKYTWGQLTTNDIVRLEGTDCFEWLGRYDNVINSGGVKIHPELLEKEIQKLIPDIPPFYLVGEWDDKWGQRLVMVVENAPEGLLDKLKALLPDRKTMPKRIISVVRLPRTASGLKIKRIIPD